MVLLSYIVRSFSRVQTKQQPASGDAELQMHAVLSSIGRRNMEKPKRFSATETDSGKETNRPIPDRLYPPATEMAHTDVHNRERLARSSRASLPMGEVFADHETHPKANGGSEGVRIAVKAKGRVLFVDPIEVVVAKAQGNYVALVHRCGAYLVRETMATAEQKLSPAGFVRIHRSILVNTSLVKDLRRDKAGTYVLRTTDGSEHPVGRAYKDNLGGIAITWLGTNLL